jgi:hypothetical protein
MNYRLEMKAVTVSSDLKDRGQAMNGHWPAHTNTNIYVQRHLWNIGAHIVLLSPQLYCTVYHGATQLAVSVVTTLKLIWGQPSDQIAVNCAELLSCCSMTMLGHILHTSVLLQWPHAACQCVGAWHIFDALKDGLSGKSIEEDRMCSSNG